ncbi:HNH endonuclease [Microbulbifer sp. SSSA005]|uniref:HNH endonuclease n=1 Tax=unclassified Microbulbifer TaxID=2619833 RepID=UPI00403AC4E3
MAIIQSPVVYSDDGAQLVEEYENTSELHHQNYWAREEVSSIKNEIKEFYKKIQKYICVYCNKKYPVKHSSVWDAEHIVPREKSPQFMFVPRNLCVACKDCNGPKSNHNVLVNSNRKTYPTTSDDFLIVHPHFDDYSDHIAIFMGSIYSPKTKKGQNTIELCNLLRFSYEAVGWEAGLAETPDVIETASALLSSDKDEQEKLTMELLMKLQINASNTLLKRK